MSSTPPEGGAISVIRPPASVEQAVTLPATSPPPSVAPPAFQTTIHAASEVPPDITVAHSLRPQAMADHIRYEVEGELGEGGIGKVLVARDTHLGRQVALKELLSDVRESMSPTEKTPVELRFVNEARITGQLEHPGIVPVYELGRRPDDTFYYTMRLVRGHTLELALAEADLEGRLALLKHVIDLCNTMAYAHSRGVIHRDLKPENVMLGDFGETVVLDWGLAKVRGETDIQHNALADELRRLTDTSAVKTIAGLPIGTPAYMPPEQAKGETEAIDERSDVYSLGVILYQLITGTIPFDGDSARAVIDKVVAGQAVPPDVVEPDCPPELGAIAVRAMAKDPEGRYPDARAMAKDLNAYLSGGLVGAHRYGSWALIRRFLRRRRRLVLGIASTLLLATVAWWYRGVAEDRREQALAEATRRTARAEVDEVFSQIARGSLRERWLEVHAFEILAKRNAATEDEVEAAVIAALAHPSVDVRRLAARTLSAMRPSVVPALVARLESGVEPSREVRIEIINALGVLRDPESDEAVRRARASEGQQSYLWTQTELAYRMIPLPAVSAGQKLSSEQWFERGTALWWKGRYAEAGAALSEAIAADPANVEAYLRRAQVRRFFNDVDGAMGDYDAVLERYPNHVSALTHRAELKQSVEDYIGALRDIDRVVRQGSLGVEALRTRALIQRFLGRYSSAQADLRRAVELEPQDAKTYTQIASVWMWAGEWRNAQRALDQALRANPSYDYARLLRAQNYLVIEERGAALADIDHVLASDPASNLARRLRAIIQLAERDERGARRDLNYCLENQCIDQESRRPLRFAQRGVVLHAGRGDYAAAMRDLKRALDGNPREVDGFIYRLAALAVARRAGDDDAVAGWLVELRRLEGPLWYHRVAAVLRGDVRLEAIQSMFHHPAQRCALFLAGGLLSETFDLAEGARILYARASEVGAPQELTCILADQASQAVGRPPSPMVLDPRPVAPLR